MTSGCALSSSSSHAFESFSCIELARSRSRRLPEVDRVELLILVEAGEDDALLAR